MSELAYYPVFLELRGKRAVVVGGGAVAERKAQSLLDAGARLTVVAPHVTAGLQALARDRAIELIARAYQPGDLAGAALALAATDDPETNQAVALEAQERNLWVNVVDTPALCSFIVPSVVRRGDLCVAISTGGKSPALARHLREEMEVTVERYERLLQVVAQVRAEVRRQGRKISPEAWQRALTPDLLELAGNGEVEQVRQGLLARLGPSSGPRPSGRLSQ